MITAHQPKITVERQCELLGLSRSSFYYRPSGPDPLDLELMRRMDRQYTDTPFYGVRRMTVALRNADYEVGVKRVRRLMRQMDLMAIYPKPRLSQNGSEHRKYPYLLRGLEITKPFQVWSADITYLPILSGFAYLAAVMDWFSRYVLAWEISNTLDGWFCVNVLRRALQIGRPEIFNTDQGVQFTSPAFTGELESRGIAVSMDGRGRVFDNIFIERLWRTVKYEDVYLKDYEDPRQAMAGLERYFTFYNAQRPHQALDYATPQRVHFGGRSGQR
jgi:putative transposase